MIKKINFSDVNPITSRQTLLIKKEIIKLINKKDFILGSAVLDFEKNFSKMSRTNFSVGCASGTDALILALMSLNLQKEDEVIVPGLTYISTGLSVLLNNNKLVFADIDNSSGLISIESVKKKITSKTKAVIPVNLYGQKVNLEKLRKAVGKNIYIIEDSAQSHFAFTKNNKKVTSDTIPYASCYSFYPAKNLGAYGDAGLITTNNKKTYNKLLALRNLGSVKKYDHFLIGLNSRLDTIQAVVLKNKLKTILNLNQKRREIARYYDKQLNNIHEIKLTKTDQGSSRHLYVIRTKNRDKLIYHLSKKGIDCIIHYPYSLNKLKAFRNRIKKVQLKNSERWANECLSLPIHPNMKILQAAKVVKEIKKYFKYN